MIDLGPPSNPGLGQRRTVYIHVRKELDIILQDHLSDMGYPDGPRSLISCESETVPAHSAILSDSDSLSYGDIVVNDAKWADDALFAVAMGLNDRGDRMAAENALLDMAKRFPDSSLRPEAYYRCGLMREKASDHEQATQYFKQAAEDGLGNFFAHRAMAKVAEDEGASTQPSPPFLADGVQAFVRPLPGLAERCICVVERTRLRTRLK